MSKISIYSVLNHNEAEIELFKSMEIEILSYDNSVRASVRYLIIGIGNDTAEWDKLLLDQSEVRFISWGQPDNVPNFILNRGVMIVDTRLFVFSPEYRKLLRGNLAKESALHLQDKLENTFELIAKTTVTHIMRYGYTIDLITAYAHQQNYDVVHLRHYLNSILLTISHLKQLGIFKLPVHIEYSANKSIFSVNITIHAPTVYLEYLMDFFQQDTKTVGKESLLWDSFRSTQFFEIAHFVNSQKINFMAMWFQGQSFTPSLNIFEVNFVKSKWETLNTTTHSLADALIGDKGWEELEKKPLQNNSAIQVPKLEGKSELAKGDIRMKALMAEVILKKSAEGEEKIQEDFTYEEVFQLLDESESKKLFEELGSGDKKSIVKALNKPVNKNTILKIIEKAKEAIEDKDHNEELTSEVVSNLVEMIDEEDRDTILNQALDDSHIENEKNGESKVKIEITLEPEAIQKIKQAVEKKYPNITVEAKKLIEESIAQKIKGRNPEELEKIIISIVSEIMKDEIQRDTGKPASKEELQSISSSIKDVLDEDKIVEKGSSIIDDELDGKYSIKSTKTDEEAEAISVFSHMSEKEKEETVRFAISDALEIADDKMLIKSFAHIFDSFADLSQPNNSTLAKKNKDVLAKNLKEVLGSLAFSLNKDPAQLTKNDLKANEATIVAQFINKLNLEKQIVRESFVNTQSNDPIVVQSSLKNEEPAKKMIIAKKILSEKLDVLVKSNLSEDDLTSRIIEMTNLPALKVLQSLQKAKNKIDSKEKEKIINFVVDYDPDADSDLIEDIDIDNNTGEKSPDKIVVKSRFLDREDKDFKEIVKDSPDKSNVNDKVVLPKDTAKDKSFETTKVLSKELKKAEEDKKRLISENLKLKVDLEAVKVKEKIAKAVQEKMIVSSRQTHGALETSQVVTNEKVVPNPERKIAGVSKSTLNADEQIRTDAAVLKKLETEMRLKENFYENEIKKMNLIVKKNELLAENLKSANNQQADNYIKKIKNLETQLDAKPIVKLLTEAKEAANPELSRFKDENEKLKRTISRLQERIANAPSKTISGLGMNRDNTPKMINGQAERETLAERIVSGHQDENDGDVKVNSRPVTEAKPFQERSVPKTSTPENNQVLTPIPKEEEISKVVPGVADKPKSEIEIAKASPLVKTDNLELNKEVSHLKNNLKKMQNELNQARSELEKEKNKEPLTQKNSAPQSKETGASAQSIVNPTSLDNRDLNSEIIELNKRTNDEIAEKNIYKNKVLELEKMVRSLQHNSGKQLVESPGQTPDSLVDTNESFKTTNVAKEARFEENKDVALKKDLREANAKVAASENKIRQLEKDLQNAKNIKPAAVIIDNSKPIMEESNAFAEAEDALRKELNKARENEQQYKIILLDAKNKLKQNEVKIKDLEETINSFTDGGSAESGAGGGGLKGQIVQLQAASKKLQGDLLKAQQIAVEAKKETISARQDKVSLQNKLVQLQKELDKMKKKIHDK